MDISISNKLKTKKMKRNYHLAVLNFLIVATAVLLYGCSQQAAKETAISATGNNNVVELTNAPEGKESNWLQTNSGEGWFPLIRTYATQQAFFDKKWQPGEFEKIN